MGRPRRSSSGGSHLEVSNSASRRRSLSFVQGGDGSHNRGGAPNKSNTKTKKPSAGDGPDPDGWAAARDLLESLLTWRDARGESLLHWKMGSLKSGARDDDHDSDGDPSRLSLASALLLRLNQVDHHSSLPTSVPQQPSGNRESLLANHGPAAASVGRAPLRERFMTQPDFASGYTPLHSAAYRGDLASVLLLLRHASWKADELSASSSSSTTAGAAAGCLVPPRLAFRPMDVLLSGADDAAALPGPSMAATCLPAVVASKDKEGLTPGQLLLVRQRRELEACRRAVLDRPLDRMEVENQSTAERRRRSSFDLNDEGDEQNEFDALHRGMASLRPASGAGVESPTNEPAGALYGCEVFTFGRAHHCALGAGHDASSDPRKASRPRRVQQFALGGARGRRASASAVSGAAHHSLVATTSGELFAFGLGKGGRLGTGDENHCPVPTRVGGCLLKRHVVSIAAAENHSVCATRCGQVFAWGSNRFGQLGGPTNGSDDGGASVRCLPRRVDDLKGLHCVQVAAGAKHSVALTKRGEIYVWGDNSAGQLGLSRRSGIHKPQRVDALWQSNNPRVAIAVAASDQATLVLTKPNQTGLRVNSVYAWGHGNHVPTRVHFEPFGHAERSRVVNPVSISSARFHNVVVTSNGLVYTWGLHADPLGTGKGKANQVLHAPQLVSGMLPENGGGFVVAASASENHTAVVTDTGALFTWGATYGKNILGHEGVRWQPDPKRVPGVHRAVGVAAAKEHTVLLIGTSFPSPLSAARDGTLEQLAACAVAQHVDLFSAIPSLIMAERAQCNELIAFCEEFVSRNLDGVLNVGQRSTMDCYLDEQIVSSTFATSAFACATVNCEDQRDSRAHPLLRLVPLAATSKRSWNGIHSLASLDDWIAGCKSIAASEHAIVWSRRRLVGRGIDGAYPKNQRSGSGSQASQLRAGRAVDCSDRCQELTVDMDLSSRELAESHLACLLKELRSARKRLSQISKLQASLSASKVEFTSEELTKVARRPQLEADVRAFEPALKLIEKRLQELALEECKSPPLVDLGNGVEAPCPTTPSNLSQVPILSSLRCGVCSISCPDEKSYALHLSGRKHRNRLQQVEDDERAAVAASIAEQRTRDQLRCPVQPTFATPPQSKSSTVWKREDSCLGVPYSLPNPPIPVPDSYVRAVPAASLRDIMIEESRKQAEKHRTIPTPTPQPSLTLPADAAPPLKSPPWANAKSSPAQPAPPSSGIALGDFIKAPSSVPPPETHRAGHAASPAWGGPRHSVAKQCRAKSFLEIQDQEVDLKLRQDKAVGLSDGNSRKWYVAQRERAASIQEIQKSDEHEREMRLFVEDQLLIEKQILEEIETRRRAETKVPAKERSGQKPRTRTRKGKATTANDR